MNKQYDSQPDRRRIEVRLLEAGWSPQSSPSPAIVTAESPFALREYSAGAARIDYALYANNRILGIVEAALDGEKSSQGLRRARGQSRLIEQQPRYQGQYGVPFLYSTDGPDVYFHDIRRPRNRARQLSAFHTPEALRELENRDLDSELATLQDLAVSHSLRHFQAEAIRAIEEAIADGRRKMILSMATGTGKTITMVNEIYRLMRAGIARRVLVLQDRTELAAQTAHIFSSLEVEPGLPFESVFPVYAPFLGVQTFAGAVPTAFSATEGPFVQISRVSDVSDLLGEGRESTVAYQDGTVNERPEVPIHAYDLIVVEECDSMHSGPNRISLRRIVRHFDAIKIGISTTPEFDGADEFGNFIVYSYDINAAVRDGSLVSSEAVRTRPIIQHWQPPNPKDDTYKHHSVFLSYAREDTADAVSIAQSLREYGVDVRPANIGTPSEEYLFPQILNELRSQDTFVILLSPASIDSPWIDNQLDIVLERRGVEVIPALLKPCPVPRSLADRTIVDLGGGVQGLVDCLEANARIDLKALSSRSFESLTLDLLRRLYFDLDEPRIAHDHGYAFRGVFRDALGFADPVEYLIEVKSQKGERSSVNALQAFANVIASDERLPRGLLVTSSQLTSIAAKALRKINEADIVLLVIDGLKLKNLLLRYPDLITNYFPAVEAGDENE